MRIVSLALMLFIMGGPACIKKPASEVKAAPTVESLQKLASKADFLKLIGPQQGGEPTVKFTFMKNSNEIYYQNTAKYPYHLQFLNSNFAEYKTLAMSGFESLIFSNPPTLLAGGLYWLDNFAPADLPSPGVIGFNMYVKSDQAVYDINVEYVQALQKRISETISFDPSRIVYIFESPQVFFRNRNKLAAVGIKSYPVNAIIGQTDKPLTYHPAKSFGYLKTITPEEFAAGSYTAKDILIFQDIPIDMGPVAGVISNVPQVPHSHVIFRAVNLNIPDIFIPNSQSFPSITQNLGKLVEFEAKEGGIWVLRGAAEIPNIQELAEQYFKSRIPALPEPRADLQETALYSLGSSKPDISLLTKYGSKGTNFALLDAGLIAAGIDRSFAKGSFLVPYSFNAAHMKQKLDAKLCAKASDKCKKDFADSCNLSAKICSEGTARSATLADFAADLVKAENLQLLYADGKVRKATIATIQYMIKKTPLLADQLALLRAELAKRWPETTRVRFRTSSNAEDLPGLTGAGLYTSKAACLADDANATEQSKCMSEREKTRIIDRIAKLKALNNPDLAALIADLEDKLIDKDLLEDTVRGVYASLWNERAFLSRDYYRIPHDKVYMAMLVHPSFADDTANGVVIVDPTDTGIRVDVVVQSEDISITNPELPGAIPEEFVANLDHATGAVSAPQYILRSNQVPAGQTVLNPEQVTALTKQLDVVWTVMRGAYGESLKRLDIEIKRNAQGLMQIKQARML